MDGGTPQVVRRLRCCRLDGAPPQVVRRLLGRLLDLGITIRWGWLMLHSRVVLVEVRLRSAMGAECW